MCVINKIKNEFIKFIKKNNIIKWDSKNKQPSNQPNNLNLNM